LSASNSHVSKHMTGATKGQAGHEGVTQPNHRKFVGLDSQCAVR
jgi:hypothetical protein